VSDKLQEQAASTFADDFWALIARIEAETPILITDIADKDGNFLFEDIDRDGVEEAARREIRSEPAGDLFLELFRAAREDLAIEHLVLGGKYPAVFDEEHRRLALERLGLFQRMRELDASQTAENDDALARFSPIGGIFLVNRKPYAVLVLNDYFDGFILFEGCYCYDLNERVVRTRSLILDYHVHAEQHHMLFCAKCQAKNPELAAVFAAVERFQFRTSRRLLHLLHQCIDAAIPRTSDDGAPDKVGSLPSDSLLALRVLVVSKFLDWEVVDAAMFVDEASREQEGNPWIWLRSGIGAPRAVAFVQDLTEGEFQAALFLHEFHQLEIGIANPSPLLLPSLGDIQEAPEGIEVVVAELPERWNEILARSPGNPAGTFQVTWRASRLEALKLSINSSTAAQGEDFGPLAERIESILSGQTATMDFNLSLARAVEEVLSIVRTMRPSESLVAAGDLKISSETSARAESAASARVHARLSLMPSWRGFGYLISQTPATQSRAR
jgi:hypothetical protein